MSLLGTVIQKSAQLGALAGENPLAPADQQRIQLFQLLKKAKNTAFGRYYGFRDIFDAPDVERAFRRAVPAADYNTLYDRWWSQAHQCDSPDVCWPGTVPYYALSSGTSQAASKFIPITEDMLRAMKRGSRSLFCDMSRFGLPARQFTGIIRAICRASSDCTGLCGWNIITARAGTSPTSPSGANASKKWWKKPPIGTSVLP
jgi:GH3 auxin-responsive promoter